MRHFNWMCNAESADWAVEKQEEMIIYQIEKDDDEHVKQSP